jgi:hypothetical protein
MTLAPADPTQTHDTLVRLDAAGKPLALRHDGQIWLVDPATESRRWYGPDAWWDTRRTAAVGSGDLVSIEYWQVQVRSGTHSALRTATLRQDPLATHWLLDNISDADETTKEE